MRRGTLHRSLMGFEKLRVYQAAEQLDAEINVLIRKVPRGFARDVDQLRRASASIPYNIAEAYGSEQPGRKISFLEISRGSADETRAILRRLVMRGALSWKSTLHASTLARTVAKMLTSWIAQISTLL
ncbi:MAG TPA: four helix bundle protein [Longimicrobiales bacterium]|nr:four helix bundle protein [Longimicrobiales bacterium]